MEPDQRPGKKQKQREGIGSPLLDLSTYTLMDERIWKELDRDLVEGVIARLPIVSFFRFRLVSREWNSLLRSHSFLQRCEEVARLDKPWFFYRTSDYNGAILGAMYDTCAKKWHVSPACSQSINPSASIGGLIWCLDDKNKCFLMGNPVTQTWKKFMWSDRTRYVGDAVGIVMCSGGYKIVTVSVRRRGEFEVYDSLSENSTASTMGKFPNFMAPEHLNEKFYSDHMELTHPVPIGTVVYFLVTQRYCSEGILSYDVVTGAFEKLDIRNPPDSTNLSLTECGGRIFLVGLVREEDIIDGPLSVRVWELQRTMLAWAEVDRMPESWCSDLFPSWCAKLSNSNKEVYLRCMGKSRMVMLSLQTFIDDRLFTYDLVTREWSKVPHFVPQDVRKPRRRLRYVMDCGVAFFPCLSDAP